MGCKTIQEQQDNKIIEITFKRENGEIVLFIKTCKEYEEYLKNNRNIAASENFCQTQEAKEIYDGRLDVMLPPDYDSAARDIIYNGKINLAVLRIKGISEGITIKIKKLFALNEDADIITKKLILDFKKFYRDFLKDFSIQAFLINKDAGF